MEVKTKYNIGDVRNVEHTNTGTRNNPQHLYFLDSACFPTKEELIKNLFNG